MAELTDNDETNGILDISALSASILCQLEDNQGLDTRQMPSLEFKGRIHGLAHVYPSLLFDSHSFVTDVLFGIA